MKYFKYILLFAIPLTLVACEGSGNAVSGVGNAINGNALAVKGKRYGLDENGNIIEIENLPSIEGNPQNCPVQPPVHPRCSVQSQIDCKCVLP